MKKTSESNLISRRRFGALLAAQRLLAAQTEARPAPGSWRRPLMADTPAFELRTNWRAAPRTPHC
jgi:hypothetical protein